MLLTSIYKFFYIDNSLTKSRQTKKCEIMCIVHTINLTCFYKKYYRKRDRERERETRRKPMAYLNLRLATGRRRVHMPMLP